MKAMIQNNTYAFYDKIGSTLEARFSKSQEISWLNTGNGFWPNMIYNTSVLEENVDDFIAKHTANIKSKIAPPFWLVEDDLIDKILAKKLNQKGLRHIMRWTGMGYKADNPLDIKLSSNTIIKTVNNVSELNAWKQILNTALMTSNKIHENIFEKLYNQEQMELYLVLENEVPVATGLAYFSDNNCGIYMISTLDEHRRKGFGSAVTKHCINAAHQKGITNIVLQASDKGVSIYQKMGFKEYCEFNILWMLGKDFK